MSGFGDTVKSPLVLAGGAAIGLVLLLSRGNSTGGVVTSAVDPSIINASVQQNKDALGAQISMAAINGELAKTKLAAQVQESGFVFSYLNTQAQSAAVIENTRIASNAGIVNNIVTTGAALAIDQSNNATRLGLAATEAQRSVTVAGIAGETIRYQAKKAAQTSLFGSIAKAIGSVASVVAAPFTGGASLIPLVGSSIAGGIGTVGGASNGAPGAADAQWNNAFTPTTAPVPGYA